jgi:hypothetical protein
VSPVSKPVAFATYVGRTRVHYYNYGLSTVGNLEVDMEILYLNLKLTNRELNYIGFYPNSFILHIFYVLLSTSELPTVKMSTSKLYTLFSIQA